MPDYSRYKIKIWLKPWHADMRDYYNLNPDEAFEFEGLSNSLTSIIMNHAGTYDISTSGGMWIGGTFNSGEDWREAIEAIQEHIQSTRWQIKLEWWAEDVTQRDEGVWTNDFPGYVPEIDFEGEG